MFFQALGLVGNIDISNVDFGGGVKLFIHEQILMEL